MIHFIWEGLQNSKTNSYSNAVVNLLYFEFDWQYVAESEDSTLLIPNPAIGHDHESIPSTSDQ
jgi:hypothetical protein